MSETRRRRLGRRRVPGHPFKAASRRPAQGLEFCGQRHFSVHEWGKLDRKLDPVDPRNDVGEDASVPEARGHNSGYNCSPSLDTSQLNTQNPQREPLAQTVEHLPFKQGVPGSSPGRLTTYFRVLLPHPRHQVWAPVPVLVPVALSEFVRAKRSTAALMWSGLKCE
jgi:hypothetical protein